MGQMLAACGEPRPDSLDGTGAGILGGEGGKRRSVGNLRRGLPQHFRLVSRTRQPRRWSRSGPRWDNRSQCISYSLDHGRTWKLYEKNPILVYPERDPKVFWYAPGNHWVMMLYGDSQYHIFTSTNLLNWKDEHKPIQDSFECPDFFELPVDGNRSNMKWVLIQGNGNYSIGSFDGTEFKEETARYPCDIGPNFYATQTWGNTETGDGRRIQAAWMRGLSLSGHAVQSASDLSLRTDAAKHRRRVPRVFREPIREIALLHNGQDTWTNRTLKANEVLPLEPSGRLFHIQAESQHSGRSQTDLQHPWRPCHPDFQNHRVRRQPGLRSGPNQDGGYFSGPRLHRGLC